MLLLCPVLLAAQARELRWGLVAREDGSIEWRGQLPDAQPRAKVQWRATAVWTAHYPSTGTMLLADTGTITSEFYPRHRVPLSFLAPPPGPGMIAFTLETPERTIRAFSVTAGASERSFQQLLQAATDAAERLRDELVVARRYGVRRPEGESLLTIAELYLGMAGASPSHGEAWLAWIAESCREETGRLRRLRTRPNRWTIVDDLPIGEIRLLGGETVAMVWTPTGAVPRPVRLVGIEGSYAPGDAELLRTMGFNFFKADGPAAADREELGRFNIAAAEQLPEGGAMIVWEPDMAPPAPADAVVVEGWKPLEQSDVSELTYHPWRLYAASCWALAFRAGKAAGGIPAIPGGEFLLME